MFFISINLSYCQSLIENKAYFDSIKVNNSIDKNLISDGIYKYKIGGSLDYLNDTTLNDWLTGSEFHIKKTEINQYWIASEIQIPKNLFNTPVYILIPNIEVFEIWLGKQKIYDLKTITNDNLLSASPKYYFPFAFSQEKTLIFYRAEKNDGQKALYQSIKTIINHFDYLKLVENKHLSQLSTISIAVFFFSVAFIYLLLFVIGTKEIKYILGAIFNISFSGYFFITSINLSNNLTTIITFLIFLTLPYSLLFFIYSFFKFNMNKIVKRILQILLLITITLFTLFLSDTIENEIIIIIAAILAVVLIIICFVYIVIGSIKALKQKITNSLPIFVGIFLLIFLVITAAICAIFTELDFMNSNWFMILTTLPLPLCILIALVRDYANSNKNLSLQLVKVEELTAQTIKEQEEKQLILSNQNEILEEQVTERTKEITEKNKFIEERNLEITDSIHYAQKIQSTLMASKELLNKNLKSGKADDYFILYKPKDIVSGDFYWAHKNEDKFIIVTADCTGHGVPGAFMSLLCVSYLNEIAKEQKIAKPDEIFNLVREKIVSNFKVSESSERKDGMDAVICIFNLEKNIVEYCAANNPIIILEPNENNSFDLIELKPDKMPVGISHDNTYKPFTLGKTDLKKGSLIYTFTDGYVDQFGGPKGKKFMNKQLRELLLTIANLSMSDQKEKLETVIENWRGNTEQTDDILIIGIRV
jgi:serine phosphatase RsbU (regulator of sigma subunit)